MTALTNVIFIVTGYAVLVLASFAFTEWILGIAKRLYRSNRKSVVTGEKPEIKDLHEYILGTRDYDKV